MFFVPTMNGLFLEHANFEPANPISTPAEIAPSWYFTPFYAILRAVPDQKYGALLMLLSILAWFFIPWLDRSPVKSMRYRGWLCRLMLGIFTISFLVLMYCGMKPALEPFVTISRVAVVGYFAFFVLMYWYTKWDQPKPVPTRVSFHHD
jgi:ubiquinol-cytochrome c reductase cytochrome b subunit